MTLISKYKLGSLIRTGEVATFEAQEVSTGRSFYVHLLENPHVSSAAWLTAEVKQRLAGAAPGSTPLIEQGDYEGAPYVVTEATPELINLQRWLETQSGSSAPSGPAGGSPETPSSEPGEFTRLFRDSGDESSAPTASADWGRRASSESGQAGGQRAESNRGSGQKRRNPAPSPPTGATREPGEFTRLFSESGSHPSRDAGSSPPPEPNPPPPPKPPQGGPASTPPASSGRSQEGEFTRLFREGGSDSASSAAGGGQENPPAAPPRNPPASPVSSESRDRESGFGSDAVAGREEPASREPEPGPQPPQAQPRQPEAPPRQQAPQPPRNEPSSGSNRPGEFTSLFGGGGQGSQSGSPQKPAGGPKDAGGHAAPPPTFTETGTFRRISPEARREEMRQFRMVSRPEGGVSDESQVAPPSRPQADPPPDAQRYSEPASSPPPPPTRDMPGGSPARHAPPPQQSQPGEFTRLFQGGGSGSPPERSRPAEPPPDRPAPQPPPPDVADPRSATGMSGAGYAPAHQPPRPPDEQPGEFTKLFRGGSESAPSGKGQERQPPPPPPRSHPPAGSGSGEGIFESGQGGQSGEFTKLFGSGGSGGFPRQDRPPGGDFTKEFGSGSPGGRAPASDPWGSPSRPVSQEPSEFTRLFGGADRPGSRGDDFLPGGSVVEPAPDQRIPDAPKQAGDFTALFGSRPGQAPVGGGGSWDHGPGGESATQMSRRPSPPPAEPQAPSGPSDYTRMMGNAPPPPRQQAQPQSPPVQAPQPPPAQAPQGQAPPPAYQAPAYPAPAYQQPPPAPAQPPPAAAPPPAAPQPGAKPESRGSSESSNRSMYLILALVFCGLLIVALGIVLLVSLTGDDGAEQAQAPVEQGGGQAVGTGGSSGSGINPNVRAPSVRGPSVSSPSVRAPSATAPSVSSSGVSGGSVTAPSATAPRLTNPSVTSPSVTTPRAPSARLPSGSAAPPAAPTETAPSQGGTPFLALIIILSVLLVISVGAAVYFALRRS